MKSIEIRDGVIYKLLHLLSTFPLRLAVGEKMEREGGERRWREKMEREDGER